MYEKSRSEAASGSMKKISYVRHFIAFPFINICKKEYIRASLYSQGYVVANK